MTKKQRRHGCLGCFMSLIICGVIVFGGLFAVYNFASFSTFGVKQIGDFELNELADYKFKDLYDAFHAMTSEPKLDEIVSSPITPTEKENSKQTWGDESSSTTPPTTGALGDINNNTTADSDKINGLEDLFTKQVVTTKHLALNFTGKDFVYLFNEIIAKVTSEGANYQDLKDLIELFKNGDNQPINIEQISLTNDSGVIKSQITFSLDITKFKGQIDEAMSIIPAFLRPKIGNNLYLTTTSTLVVTSENGAISIQPNKSTININTINAKMSDVILSVLIASIGNTDLTTTKIAETITSAFNQVANNLGGVGKLENELPIYGTGGISSMLKEKGGSITIVTRTTSAN